MKKKSGKWRLSIVKLQRNKEKRKGEEGEFKYSRQGKETERGHV